MITCTGGQIAVVPFAQGIKTVVDARTGFARPEQFSGLTPVLVVFGNERIPAGATVWLRGDAHAAAKSKVELTVEGKTFVFVDEVHVQLVDQVVRRPVPEAGTVKYEEDWASAADKLRGALLAAVSESTPDGSVT